MTLRKYIEQLTKK